MFTYNPVHHVVVCHSCTTCILPGRVQQTRHLRAKPHHLTGHELKATLELFNSYDLFDEHTLKENQQQTSFTPPEIPHLRQHSGFQCLQNDCTFVTTSQQNIGRHTSKVHDKVASLHKKTPLWKDVKLQTYFVSKPDYFVVTLVIKDILYL